MGIPVYVNPCSYLSFYLRPSVSQLPHSPIPSPETTPVCEGSWLSAQYLPVTIHAQQLGCAGQSSSVGNETWVLDNPVGNRNVRCYVEVVELPFSESAGPAQPVRAQVVCAWGPYLYPPGVWGGESEVGKPLRGPGATDEHRAMCSSKTHGTWSHAGSFGIKTLKLPNQKFLHL